MEIETENLLIIQCDAQILEAAIAGKENLARKLGVIVHENWTEFGIEPLRFSYDRLSASEEEKGWWTYLPKHKKDNKIIGSGGYKGKPTLAGTVELGYEIALDYRNQGLATEMTMGLIEHAYKDSRVKLILAHTLGYENPSTSVLKKCGFKKVDEMNDPDDGLIWKWELKRE